MRVPEQSGSIAKTAGRVHTHHQRPDMSYNHRKYTNSHCGTLQCLTTTANTNNLQSMINLLYTEFHQDEIYILQ